MKTHLSYNQSHFNSANMILPVSSPDLNQCDAPLQQCSGETWLSDNKCYPNIAVIELSTKAVKLLIDINPDATRSNLFSFNNFHREAVKTETGMLLDFRNNMDEIGFRNRVLPIICEYVRIAKNKYHVDMILTVATAAYRTAENRKKILAIINKEAKINVRILSKKEEAEASFNAYVFSSSNRQKLLSYGTHILFDQGGGSTEVSLFRDKEFLNSHSLGIGTTLLKNLLFRKLSENLEVGITRISDIAAIKTQKELAVFDGYCNNFGNALCIGLGTAVTHATGAPNNRTQHEKILTIDKLLERRKILMAQLCDNYKNVQDIKDALSRIGKESDNFDRILVTCLSIPSIIAVMEYFNIQKITVSGTSLYYGIFFKKFFHLK